MLGRARLALPAALLAITLAATSALAGGRTTTSEDIPSRRAETETLVRTSTADTAVQVNVDIGMAVKAGSRCVSRYPGACKGQTYHPCFNLDDPAYADCQTYTLYRIVRPATDLAQGILIGSTADVATGRTITHGWARKITVAHLEVYASDPAGLYGDVRIRVNDFPHRIAGRAESNPIGHIRLPLAGTPGTGAIEGRAVGANGKPMPPRSFKFDVFGHTDTGRRTGVAGEGAFMEYGFGRATVERGVTDGTFRTRPLFTGTYDVHVQRKGGSYRCLVTVKGGAVRFDLDFSKKGLGQKSCRPMRSLVRTVPG